MAADPYSGGFREALRVMKNIPGLCLFQIQRKYDRYVMMCEYINAHFPQRSIANGLAKSNILSMYTITHSGVDSRTGLHISIMVLNTWYLTTTSSLWKWQLRWRPWKLHVVQLLASNIYIYRHTELYTKTYVYIYIHTYTDVHKHPH